MEVDAGGSASSTIVETKIDDALYSRRA